MKLTPNVELVRLIKEALAEDAENENSLRENELEHNILIAVQESEGYESIQPFEVGALTDAPMLCDDSENPTEVWAFMDYAVTSIPARMLDRGCAILEYSEVERKNATIEA
jgi:hypothetical protein